jgi:hypothetical protein
MSLPVPLTQVSVRALCVVPVAILVVLALLLALFGLPLRQEGRRYVSAVIQVALTAACALMAGCPLQTAPRRDTESPPH